MNSRFMSVPILGLLLLLASWAGAVTQKPKIDTRYRDPKQPMNLRIKSLIDQMTLKEKIGQMAQIDRIEATPEILRDYSIGSEWVDMVNVYQKGSLSSRLGIPMLYAIDSVHGHNSLYKATIFPHNVGLGATRDPELVKRIGAATAVETRATGIPYVFAPCIAVCRDPRWGRCYESYSEDHKIVEQMTEIILGLQGDLPSNLSKGAPYVGGKDKVVACAKHYVGDGGTIRGIDENNTLTDWKGLVSIHMPAYYHSIIKGVSTIMVSYSSWNGVKMHSNRDLVTQFLKSTLKFRGFVISDWQGVDRMTYPWGSNYSTSLLKAINAGVDMIMVPPNHTEFLHILTSHVNNNLIPMSRIDDAFCLVLYMKPKIDTRYRDPKQPMNLRIKSLIDQMTLKEKIGQMAQIDRIEATPEILRDYSIGSEWVDMVNVYQKGSLSSRLGIPMLYAIDSVHGHNSLYKATIFPHNVGLGATRDPELVKRIGAATAVETRATGIPYVFAPCIAVCRDPRWGRCYESYSEDHKIVEQMTEIILGLQGDLPSNLSKGAPYVGGKDKVVACAKHYVGDGGTIRGIDENNTLTDWKGLVSIHMPAYYHSIIKGVSTIMVSYSSWNGVKMHSNRDLVTQFLKSTLKFRGFVISDWQGVDRMTYPWGSNYSTSLLKAINAGVDMIMVPPNHTEFLHILTSHVNNNLIPMSRIDDAVRRILRVKFSMGLFENPLADYDLVDQIGTQPHRDLAREAVRKSLVLLKNGKDAKKPLLPLPKKTSKILVAGSHANNLGLQCGGWTITWQGLNSNNLTIGTTILNAISATVDPSTEIVYSENPDTESLEANKFSYAIVVVGEPPYAEGYGDNLNLTIPQPGLSTMTNVCSRIKCVVVLISGRPLVVEPYLPMMDALVAAWLPGTEGQGVADVLFGDYGFTGKLPRTWFKSLLLLLLASWPGSIMTQEPNKINTLYKDPKQPMNLRIKSLIDQMTLKEKVGQMAQIDRLEATPEILRDYSIGSPEEWVDMVNDYQKGSLSSRLGIPMLYAIDSVHGHNSLYEATLFPHNVGLGATRDPELVKKIGAATAIETRATGIPFAFAPCIAVCRDPRWGRCYESYSEDPHIVQQMTDIILGLQGEIPPNSRKGVPYIGGKDKVVACAKHFVGDGGTIKGIDENNTIIDWHGLLSLHMPGYYQSIIKGVSTIMVSYSSWNGMKMHSNKNLVTDFLKGTLKFRGFVISDWQGVDRMTYPWGSNYSTSLQKAINAGVDMVMVPPNHTEFLHVMTSHVKNNLIPMNRIDDAVARILRVKFTLGLFENPLADYSLVDQIRTLAHRHLAREAVRKSLVLLKNGKDARKPLLPLPKKTSKILVAGTHANNLGLQCGGWTINWQGLNSNNLTTGTTILNAISATIDPSTEIVYSENPDSESLKANNYSYGIVVVGEPPYAEGYGDNLNLTIPEPGLSTMINVCSRIKCVVVLISGRPLVVEPYLPRMDALVAAWLPGTEGQGVADVLFGDYGFTGKLPRTWFKRVDQLPMNVGDEHYDPLFPFGFGLTTQPTGAI
ncbi:hypothetical protein Pfo_014390 [Paulownia fortunei]|nr:hypothetical protein Pfo_014390 [Paulownia fortunei]